jgi:hypothetical protein
MDDERRLRGLRTILEQIQDRVRYALKELDARARGIAS